MQNYAHYCCGSHYQRIYKTKANKRLGRCFSRFSSREHSELCTFLELKNLFGSHATVHRATFFRLIRRRYAKMNRSKDYILGLAPLLHAFSFASKDTEAQHYVFFNHAGQIQTFEQLCNSVWMWVDFSNEMHFLGAANY